MSEVLVSKTHHDLPNMDMKLTPKVMFNVHGIVSAKRHSKVSSEEMARKWGIRIEKAKDML
jgi:hypothetical protein